MARVIYLDNSLRGKTTQAVQFGEVVFLFDEYDTRPSSFDPTFQLTLKEKLYELDFDPETDYIAVTGKYINTVLLVATVVVTFGTVSLLLFDARLQRYLETKLPFE